jgi:hypothetical protein
MSVADASPGAASQVRKSVATYQEFTSPSSPPYTRPSRCASARRPIAKSTSARAEARGSSSAACLSASTNCSRRTFCCSALSARATWARLRRSWPPRQVCCRESRSRRVLESLQPVKPGLFEDVAAPIVRAERLTAGDKLPYTRARSYDKNTLPSLTSICIRLVSVSAAIRPRFVTR